MFLNIHVFSSLYRYLIVFLFFLFLLFFSISALGNFSNGKFMEPCSINIKFSRYLNGTSQYPCTFRSSYFFPDTSTLVSNIFQHFISGKRILASGSGIRQTIFLLFENTARAFSLFLLLFSIPQLSISRVVTYMMSFHPGLNLCQGARSHFVVVIQNRYTVNDTYASFI